MTRQDLQEIVVENPRLEPEIAIEDSRNDSQILRNLLFFLAHAKDSDKLITDALAKLSDAIPEERKQIEMISKFQKITKVFRENFEALGFFEDKNAKEIGQALQSSLERTTDEKHRPTPESKLELSSFRSYLTASEGFDFRDRKFFNSLDRDSQSILMGCAIIICAIDAINKTAEKTSLASESQGLLASDRSEYCDEILNPLIKYSQNFSKSTFSSILSPLINIGLTIGFLAPAINSKIIPDGVGFLVALIYGLQQGIVNFNAKKTKN